MEGAETKGAGAASGGGHCRRRGDLEGPRTDGFRCDDVSGGGGGAPLYHQFPLLQRHAGAQPDSYTVNTLVSGEILSDTFEKGDQVEEGQLLYTIDSSNAASSQTQAQNSYSQAQTSYEQAVKAKYPQADLSGTVSEVYVNEGDSVSAGTQLSEDRGG